MKIDVTDLLLDFVTRLLGSEALAAEFQADPVATLAAEGLTDHDLTGIDVSHVIAAAAATAPRLPESVRAAISTPVAPLLGETAAPTPIAPGPEAHSFSAAPRAHVALDASADAASASQAAAPFGADALAGDDDTLAVLISRLQHVTTIVHEGDTIASIDNSVDWSTHVELDVEGTVHGGIDVEVEPTNVAAHGDGAIAADGTVQNSPTGDDAIVVDGPNRGTLNSGDGAVVGNNMSDSPTNTGLNTGVLASGAVEDTIVGDDNELVDFEGSRLDDSIVSTGTGNVTNTTGNTVTEGSLAVGGDAVTNHEDNDIVASGNTTNDNDVTNSGNTDDSGDVAINDSGNTTTDTEIYDDSSDVTTDFVDSSNTITEVFTYDDSGDVSSSVDHSGDMEFEYEDFDQSEFDGDVAG